MKTTALLFALLAILFTFSASYAIDTETNDSAQAKTIKALPRMLELGSVGCVPCMKMAPIIDSLKEEYRGVVSIEFYDVKKDPTQARAYKIMLIPTQIFLTSDGKEFYRHTGFFEKDSIVTVFNKMKVGQ